MAYVTQTDLEAYFGTEQLLIAADRDGDGSYDTDVISTGITAATEEIDTYVGIKYELPLAATPGVLTRVGCDLAMYHMSVGHHSMTEDKKERYNNGVRWLRDLAAGKVTLGPEEDDVTAPDEAELYASIPERLFTRSKMEGLF